MFWPDVTELKTFYDSRLGQVCTQSIRRTILKIWPEAKGETLLGIGYALPCLRPFLKSADIVVAAMPAGQGVIHWPKTEDNLTLLSHENSLPFRSNTLNRIIIMHALEYSQPLTELLREADRLLTPSGRMLVIVPNRRSLWARAEHTPYAQGQPYSLTQLKHLLEKHSFYNLQSKQALFFPPLKSRTILRFSRIFERICHRFFPHFGGVLMVEVEKRKTAPASGKTVKAFVTATQATQAINRNAL